MPYVYDDCFFDYIDSGAARSARLVIARALDWMSLKSVLDVGCGRGAWLAEWRKSGVADIAGVDGEYVTAERLYIEQEEFTCSDLSQPLDLGRHFDLVQSLEVAEHLPPGSAGAFVDSLCRHGDLVLFSAAVVGQGGENHINEQPLEFWRALFAERGYAAYDCVRPIIVADAEVEPWYRYNTVLYAKANAVDRLPDTIKATLVSPEGSFASVAPLSWRIRLNVVAIMPRRIVDAIARMVAWQHVLAARRKA
jgi:SAM-dependent methyltransferase